MRRQTLLIICLLLAYPPWAMAALTCDDPYGGTLSCDFYASGTGAGSACDDENTPCTIETMISQMTPGAGETGCLLGSHNFATHTWDAAGTYQGPDQMIVFNNYGNTSNPPLDQPDTTICAIDPYGVLVDAEYSTADLRAPIDIIDSDNIRLIRIFGYRGGAEVVRVRQSSPQTNVDGGGSSYVTLDFVRALHTFDNNENKVCEFLYADHIVTRDSACMGQGRKPIHDFQSYTINHRRLFNLWLGMDTPNAKDGFDPNYCSADVLAENVFTAVAWTPATGPTGGSFSGFLVTHNGTNQGLCRGLIQDYGETKQNRYYGTLLMQRQETKGPAGFFADVFVKARQNAPNFNSGGVVCDSDIQDFVSWNETRASGQVVNFVDDTGDTGPSCVNERNDIQRVAFLGGSAPDTNHLQARWCDDEPGGSSNGAGPTCIANRADITHAATPAGLSGDGVFTVGGNLPNLCQRYVAGTLTSTGLWPWPDDAGIKTFLAYASTVSGDPLNGLGANFLESPTEIMEAEFGAIPAACITSGGGPAAQSPSIMLHGLKLQGLTLGK